MLNKRLSGSCCGGRTFDTTRPGFESNHPQLLMNIYLLLIVSRKDENNEKEAENGPLKNLWSGIQTYNSLENEALA